MTKALIVGWIIGLAVAIPPGPFSVTVFTYAMERGSRAALSIALGGMIFEILYALAGFLGLSIAEDAGLGLLLRGISCVLFIYLGAKHTFGPIVVSPDKVKTFLTSGIQLSMLGLVLTATTPTITAAYLVLGGFAYSHEFFDPTLTNAIVASLGAAIGSMSWVVFTLFLIHSLRSSLKVSSVRYLTRGAGILMLVVALWLAIDIFGTTFGGS